MIVRGFFFGNLPLDSNTRVALAVVLVAIVVRRSFLRVPPLVSTSVVMTVVLFLSSD